MEKETEANFVQQALEMKRAYYRYMSHEIRTPLSVASLGLNLIETDLPPDSPQHSSEINTNVRHCKEAIESAVNILTDLIDNEKLESKLVRLEGEYLSFLSVLSSVLGPFSLMARQKKILLLGELNLDPLFVSSSHRSSLPSVGEVYGSTLLDRLHCSGKVHADSSKLSQVVRNLLSNALKFTPEGREVRVCVSYLSPEDPRVRELGLSPRTSNPSTISIPPVPSSPLSPDSRSSSFKSISFSSFASSLSSFLFPSLPLTPSIIRPSDIESSSPSNNHHPINSHFSSGSEPMIHGPPRGYLLCEVIDRGAGIKKEDQIRLFSEAFQISPGKMQAGGGSGLGLYNSKRIVELHGGKMFMSSEGEGKGCTFSFSLPLYRIEDQPPSNLNPFENNSFRKILTVSPQRQLHPSPQIESTPPQSQLITFLSPSISQNESRLTYQFDFSSNNTLHPLHPLPPHDLPQSNMRSKRIHPSSSSSSSITRTTDLNSSPACFMSSDVILNNDDRISLFSADDSDSSTVSCSTPGAMDSLVIEKRQPRIKFNDTDLSSPNLRLINTSFLLVEDTEMIRKFTRKTLEARQSGNRCYEAQNGLLAVQLVRDRMCRPTCISTLDWEAGEREFGVVLLDSDMPGLDGPQTVCQLRSLGYRGLVVGLTGNVVREDVDHFVSCGVDGVLEKPLNYGKLVEIAHRYHLKQG